jgi:radical SAM superfamily enzyme YgiQ (UPF0313 family)
MTMDAASKYRWVPQICEEWHRRGLAPAADGSGGVHWAGTSHASLYRPQTLALMREAGCSHLVYGLESFDPGILKKLGKGTTREHNIRAVRETLTCGIAPIPNLILGFPEESFDSIRNTITGMLELGIHARPHLCTAYPGSEYFYSYKDFITEQYGENLEAYILDLGDATKITATISQNFTGMELLGLQEIMYRRDLRLLDIAERAWIQRPPLMTKQASRNFVAKKLNAPVESGRQVA